MNLQSLFQLPKHQMKNIGKCIWCFNQARIFGMSNSIIVSSAVKLTTLDKSIANFSQKNFQYSCSHIFCLNLLRAIYR